ncbi:MAG: RNA polymerase sigma factor [Thermoleophilia bacterium]
MAVSPGLIRFAARYTHSLQDAEDAYQRSMEIALTRAPVTEERRFMAWLHIVLRNEAIDIARRRRRERLGVEADVAETASETLVDAVAVDAVAEWRERYHSIRDGLASLTEAQRICLILQCAGASYERIVEITGYSLRKVERSVLEGRANLHTWEIRVAAGEVCEKLIALIGRVAGGEARVGERMAVSRHVRHCGPCRAMLRGHREANGWLAALAPLALLADESLAGATLDPSPALAWWDRLAGGATMRMGNAVQMAMELPGAALAKVGAGTAAVVVAGAAGTPMVVDAMRPGETPAPVVSFRNTTTQEEAAVRQATDAVDAAARTRERLERQARQRQARQRQEAKRAAAKRAAARAAATAAASAPRYVASAPSPSPRASAPRPVVRQVATPPPPPASAVAAEFGP